MRRLPVYFVIDVSESMVGEPIKKVEDGIRSIITALKKDPHALETVYISIIVFAGKAKTLVPLTDIISFYPPKFSIGSGTSYGQGIKHLITELETNVIKTTHETKGDWKPIIFFMTDGNPTDDFIIDIGRWEQHWKDKSNVVVVSIGDHTSSSILKRISNEIIAFDDSDPESYTAFFKWVTSSIQVQSQRVEEGTGNSALELGGFDKSKLKKIDPFNENEIQNVDEHCAIFNGKCQTTKKAYLVKYKKGSHNAGFVDMPNLSTINYRLDGSYVLDDNYLELSDSSEEKSQQNSVSTELLRGIPNCPSCGNRFAMAVCSCGNIFCLDGGGLQTCPHCGIAGNYGAGDGHIDIKRQQG